MITKLNPTIARVTIGAQQLYTGRCGPLPCQAIAGG
jgi:hypothetical protein